MKWFLRVVKLHHLALILISVAMLILTGNNLFAQEFTFKDHRKKQAISFTYIRNLVIIPLYINHKGPFNFILDTGVGPLVITDVTILDSTALKDLRPVKISGFGKGLEINALLSNQIAADVGKASVSSMAAAILEEDVLGLSNYVGIKVCGLIGYAFFKSFIVEINYTSKRVIFQTPTSKRRLRGEMIPIQIINNKPYVNIEMESSELGKVTLKMVVDNGASHAISLETWNDKPFPLPSSSIVANLGVGLNGPISGNIGRTPSIKIGSFILKNVLSSYPTYDDAAARTLLLNRNGNLGADILSHFNITFDYSNELMYLRKNQYFKRPFEHDMSGIEVYIENSLKKRFFISRIEPGSPADKSGIAVNDEILSVNFTKSQDLSLDDLSKMFRASDGRTLLLTLNRNGSFFVKMIKLKKRI